MVSILILPGDGIGVEISAQAEKVLLCLNEYFGLNADLNFALIGGSAYDKTGSPLPDKTLKLARDSNAILLGAVGGYQWEKLPREVRPERGLLSIRSELNLFANLRPAFLYPQLADTSTLKFEIVSGLDIMIVRELIGGIYFGKPRGVRRENGERLGFNSATYLESEIERIAHSAFQIAQKRNKHLCSVDKANVLEVCELWREVVSNTAEAYPDVVLSHLYIDNATMQLVKNPKQFDVILTSNLFGDVLSDLAAMLTGSIGMLPSASLNEYGFGLYEPVHGSAPHMAGKNTANPLAIILSIAMMLRYSLNKPLLAELVEKAIYQTLDSNYRTADIASACDKIITTSEMGDAVVSSLMQLKERSI